MIELRPVDRNNIEDVLALKVHEYQKTFVSTVAESLAQAYVYHDNAYPFAVYNDDEIVGFIMMGYYEVKHYYTLWKFLIDKEHQHKSYGRQALTLGINYLKDRFDIDSVYTGVAPDNSVAKHFYRSFGFEFTGLIELGMEEMRLECT